MPRGPDRKKRKKRSDTKPKTWHQYRAHRRSALKSGKVFNLTYEEWLDIWNESGHLHERGTHRGQYVMARTGDKGGYEVGNVRIATVEENLYEEWNKLGAREAMCAAMVASHIGIKDSLATRENKRTGAITAWELRLPLVDEAMIRTILRLSATVPIRAIARTLGLGRKRVRNLIQRNTPNG